MHKTRLCLLNSLVFKASISELHYKWHSVSNDIFYCLHFSSLSTFDINWNSFEGRAVFSFSFLFTIYFLRLQIIQHSMYIYLFLYSVVYILPLLLYCVSDVFSTLAQKPFHVDSVLFGMLLYTFVYL